MSLRIESNSEGVIVSVKVVPGGSKDQIVGLLDDMLKIKVSAPPEGGKANKAVCALLAKILGVSKQHVTVVGGMTQPQKRVRIIGVTRNDIEALVN